MRQHPNPNPNEDEDDLEELGTPIYEGTGLSVRAMTAEQLQRFLDAHAGQPTRRLGSGWPAAAKTSLFDQTGLSDPRRFGLVLTAAEAPRWGSPELPGPAAAGPFDPGAGSLGRPGRSALATYRRQRAAELAAWRRSLVWRAPVVAAAGLIVGALAGQVGLTGTLATLAGLAAAATLLGWRLRYRPSEQARAWQRGAAGERQTARLLDRLGRDGYVVFHDLAMPDSAANIDHLVIGPSGLFVIDSKQWTGSVHQSADGLLWHNHYRLDHTLGTIRWQALTLGHLLGVPVAPLICIHGAIVQGGGLRTQGVAVVPPALLRSAMGYDQVLSEAEVELYAATARMRLRPAA